MALLCLFRAQYVSKKKKKKRREYYTNTRISVANAHETLPFIIIIILEIYMSLIHYNEEEKYLCTNETLDVVRTYLHLSVFVGEWMEDLAELV